MLKLFSFLLLVLATTLPLAARAQVVSSAFDPHCYQPQIGVPGEIDTIVGGNNQRLGDPQVSIGPDPHTGYNRDLIGGYTNNPGGLDIVSGGPAFNLLDLNKPKSKFAFPYINYGYLGHFHSPDVFDILYMDGSRLRIYWADTNGDFDSSRFTTLDYHSAGTENFALAYDDFTPYIAHLTSNALDDLVFCFLSHWYPQNGRPDTQYAVLYKGEGLYRPGDTVLNDSAVYFPELNDSLNPVSTRVGLIGDFRESGREDYIASDRFGNVFIYKNDPTFDLAKFADAMNNDTIYAPWQNPRIKSDSNGRSLSIEADNILPHSNKTARDLNIIVNRPDDVFGNRSNNIFRANPNFGSHRITIDDTDFCVRSPGYYDASWFISWPGGFEDCGDMTGTGNPVLMATGSEPEGSFSFFYVMGSAADPFVDMYVGTGFGGDTITADGDQLEDLISCDGSYPDIGLNYLGSIRVLHGSAKIPATPNPRFAVVNGIASNNGIGLTVQTGFSFLKAIISLPQPGRVDFTIYNLLGVRVFEQTEWSMGTEQVFTLPLSGLASGAYVLEAASNGSSQRTVFTIVR